MVFKIGQAEVKKRQINMLLGLLFSVLFVTFINIKNNTDNTRYNDLLFLSVSVFFAFSNVINLGRHIQWKKSIKTHQIEILADSIIFSKDAEKEVLEPEKVAKIDVKRRGEEVKRIIIVLVIGNKIRLEGYNDMNLFAELLAERTKPRQKLANNAISP